MSEIRYNFGQIEAVLADLTGSKQQVDALLEELKSYVRGFVDAHWDGAAKQSYVATQAKWDAASLELNTVLNGVIRTAAQGTSDMHAVEMANAASWG